MSGWEEVTTYAAGVLPGEQDDSALEVVEQHFADFIQEFALDHVYLYRDQLRQNLLSKNYVLDVNIEHLISFNEELAHRLVVQPFDILKLFENAVKICATRILYPARHDERVAPDCQVTLHSSAKPTSVRGLNSNLISKLVQVPGIVIGAQSLQSRATKLALVCRGCQHVIHVPVAGGWSGISLPSVCENRLLSNETKSCPRDPYVIAHEKSSFVDQQNLKLQELPDMIPVGELPRHIPLCADRTLANVVSPGTRCIITGIYTTTSGKDVKGKGAVALGKPYIQVVGIQVDSDGNSKTAPIFTDEEEESFLEMSRDPELYERFSRSIGPAIYGNENIKKAITCLLVGGSKKILPDGMRLRGDINVLLLGDPGTAKSQLLKFVEKVAPVSVYTSGKGSSAAGLTASVQRDHNSGDFYLEGGAMVLADGGVVCIDEFDKMRDEDRVAIHEAMEQQTISIAKAGITTILNSRTSVLAAANPLFGRYDDVKSPGENIDFQTTVLSRFDMIFIVKDEHNEARDMTIAKHVISIHKNNDDMEDDVVGEIPIDKMRRYVSYCRHKIAPRLSAEAAEKLSGNFVAIRKQVHAIEQDSNERSSIPITIRQLEAIIRITESIAKLHLRAVASESDVDEAMRLFLASTMDAVGQGQTLRQELLEDVGKIEQELRKRLPIGWSASYAALSREFVQAKGYSQHALQKALQIMERRDTIQLRNQGSSIYRCGA